MSRIEMLESTRDNFFSQLVASLRIKRSGRNEIADAILENIQNIMEANEDMKIQIAEMEMKTDTQNDQGSSHKTPKNLRKLLQRAMVTTMKRNRAVNLFKISPQKSVASKTKSVRDKRSRQVKLSRFQVKQSRQDSAVKGMIQRQGIAQRRIKKKPVTDLSTAMN